MPARRPPLPPWLRGLRRADLVADPVLVLGDPDLARRLARHGVRVQAQLPARHAPPTFGTVIDLGWTAARPPSRRRAALRELSHVVLHDGVLHVQVPREAASLRAPGPPWQLLTAHEVDGAWIATFVHVPRVRPGGREPAVRHFTDLDNFGSLDLGTSADRWSPP